MCAKTSCSTSTVAPACTLLCIAKGPGARRQSKAVRTPLGISLLFAQAQIETAHELAAEHHVQHLERVIVGRTAGGGHMTDPELRLDGAGPVDEDESGRRWPGRTQTGRVHDHRIGHRMHRYVAERPAPLRR